MLANRLSRRVITLLAILLLTLAANAAAGPIVIKISGSLPATGDAQPFTMSPTGSHVAFLADAEIDGLYALYSARVTGGAPAPISPPRDADLHRDWAYTADGARLIFARQEPGVAQWALYSAPAGGPPAATVLLAANLGDDFRYQLTPDGQTVVFTSLRGDEGYQLYAAPVTGPTDAARRISGAFADYGAVGAVQVALQGRRVFWTADPAGNGVAHLYTRRLDDPGAAIVRLSDRLGGAGVASLGAALAVSPDGTRVAYLGETAAERAELFVVPIDGPASANVKLNPPLVAGGGLFALAWSPDGGRVVYMGYQESTAAREVYAAPVTGPAAAATKLSRPIAPADSGVQSLTVTDNGWVVYSAYETGADSVRRKNMYAAPVNGTAADARLIAREMHQEAVAGERLIYAAGSWREVYAVPLSGPEAARVALGGRGPFCVSANGEQVVVRGPGNLGEELFLAPVVGGALAPVSGTMTPRGASDRCAFSPDNQYIVYRADQEIDQKFEIYSSQQPQATDTPTPTDSPTPMDTATPEDTETPTLTPSPTATATATATPLPRLWLPVLVR